mmetsp:Transcript_22727/g.55288  ORF Transcript_22727/g.55288 Transcript_22727/m.55288 type:complete len:367 (-) Transcript_22727:140-1240(-)
MLERIGCHYWWPTMRTDIASAVRACTRCGAARLQPERKIEPKRLVVTVNSRREVDLQVFARVVGSGDVRFRNEEAKAYRDELRPRTDWDRSDDACGGDDDDGDSHLLWTFVDLNSTHKLLRVTLEKSEPGIRWPSLENPHELKARLSTATIYPSPYPEGHNGRIRDRLFKGYDLERMLDAAKIFPAVVPRIALQFPLQVACTSGKQPNNGDLIFPKDLDNPPSFRFLAEEGKLYTILMLNPDHVMCIREGHQFLHWIRFNVDWEEARDGIYPMAHAKNKRVLLEGRPLQDEKLYFNPIPMPEQRERIVFVVCEQTGQLNITAKIDVDTLEPRHRFQMESLCTELEILHAETIYPVSMNFFQLAINK